jgi:acetylornithine deacetylase
VIDALPGLGVQPDVCLIAEPTDLRLCRTHRGFAVMSVTFTGKATHSSQPELGVNAVTHLGRFLHAVDLHAATVRERGGALMSTMVSGGESMFVVPESADCIVEMRTPPDQSAATALGEVESLLDREWQADAELVLHRDGWRIDDAGPAADLAARLGEALDTATSFDAPYWMEAPLWQRVCPTVICGPSGGGMHAADEWVDLRQVRAFTHALEAVLAD